MRFVLHDEAERALREHARLAFPREACGLVARGRRGRQRYVAMTNVARTRTSFEIDPVEFARRERELREEQLWVCAFFHSHPDGPATPSPADMAAAWPRQVQLILGEGGSLTAWYKRRSRDALQPIRLRASS